MRCPIKHRTSSGVDHAACEKAQQWPAVLAASFISSWRQKDKKVLYMYINNRLSCYRGLTEWSKQYRSSSIQDIKANVRQNWAILLLNKVACLTSRVVQLLTSRATKLETNVYSSATSRSVAEPWLVSCLFTCPWISLKLSNIHPTPLIECWSN